MSGVVSSVAWSVWEPTATTVPSLRAVTPISELERVPGFGLLMIVQLVPSQCSVSVADTAAGIELADRPDVVGRDRRDPIQSAEEARTRGRVRARDEVPTRPVPVLDRCFPDQPVIEGNLDGPHSPDIRGGEPRNRSGRHIGDGGCNREAPARAVEVQDRRAPVSGLPHGPDVVGGIGRDGREPPAAAMTLLETMLQLVPSQCSTRAFPPAAPTAQTLFDETTVTPLRLSCSIVGPVVSTLQFVPFQCSINCSPKSGLSGPVLLPTAQTSLLAAAATPEIPASGGFTPPLGRAGVGTMLQLVPLKCSASVESTTGGATT